MPLCTDKLQQNALCKRVDGAQRHIMAAVDCFKDIAQHRLHAYGYEPFLVGIDIRYIVVDDEIGKLFCRILIAFAQEAQHHDECIG